MKRITEEGIMKLEDEVQLNFKGEIWSGGGGKKRKEKKICVYFALQSLLYRLCNPTLY